jgi:hypothetical protein
MPVEVEERQPPKIMQIQAGLQPGQASAVEAEDMAQRPMARPDLPGVDGEGRQATELGNDRVTGLCVHKPDRRGYEAQPRVRGLPSQVPAGQLRQLMQARLRAALADSGIG